MTERIENEDDLRQEAEPRSSPPGTTSDMTAHLCASGHNPRRQETNAKAVTLSRQDLDSGRKREWFTECAGQRTKRPDEEPAGGKEGDGRCGTPIFSGR